MPANLPEGGIRLSTAPADMRKSFDGLAGAGSQPARRGPRLGRPAHIYKPPARDDEDSRLRAGRLPDPGRRLEQGHFLARPWARKGTRPRVVRDRRYGYCCLFSAACPERGASVGHAVAVLDGAGWHRSKALEIPGGVSLLRLPPCSPEPDSMENVFNCLKSSFLANRLFPTVGDARDAVLAAWETFAAQPELIASIMSRDWAVIDWEMTGILRYERFLI